jgi:hypothetical protein
MGSLCRSFGLYSTIEVATAESRIFGCFALDLLRYSLKWCPLLAAAYEARFTKHKVRYLKRPHELNALRRIPHNNFRKR